MKFFLILLLGVVISSVVLATVFFVPVAVPTPPPGFLVACGAPTPPPGFILVCYDKVSPGLEDVLRLVLILGANAVAFTAFGRAITGTVRRPIAAV